VLRLPFGVAIACLCIGIAIVLLARLTLREGFLLLITFAIATLNWFFVRKKNQAPEIDSPSQVESLS
jgi:hypothetical protein